MPPDRVLENAEPGSTPTHEDTQHLIEAESGQGTQGIKRTWQASNSALVVLTSDAAGVKISRDDGHTSPSQVIVDGTPAGGGLTGSYPNPTVAPGVADVLAPPGAIVAYAGAAWPSGWLPCDGSTFATASYPRLYAAIGTTYNTGGEAAGSARLPNLLGRVILCTSGTHARGQVGGSESPAHTHPGLHNHGAGTHTHPLGGHTHALAGHTHGIGHQHGMDHQHTMGHQHTTDINHDHALAAGVAVASGAITGVHEGPSAVVNVSASNHAHDVDLPGLGTLSKTSDSYGASPPLSGGTTTQTATGPGGSNISGDVSAGPGAGGPPSPNASDASTGTTADNTTFAPSANYGADGLPPFMAMLYIIRAV